MQRILYLLSKEIQNHSIENRLMVQLKMYITKTGNNVTAPIAGDDGEAMAKVEENKLFMAGNEPKMPVDAGGMSPL